MLMVLVLVVLVQVEGFLPNGFNFENLTLEEVPSAAQELTTKTTVPTTQTTTTQRLNIQTPSKSTRTKLPTTTKKPKNEVPTKKQKERKREGVNSKPIKNFDFEFDFVIVGSGSAGAVIANRLSKISQWSVLLLEAGGRGNSMTEVPLLAPIFQLTPYNWNYTMEPQNNVCLGMIDHRCPWPRGKALGGSTIINYMIYTRGNPLDFDKWSKLNISGWNYQDILPFYLKSENCALDKCKKKYHKKHGLLNVEYPFSTKLTQTFLDSGLELGYKTVDYNSNNFMGFAKIQANLKKGKRDSVTKAFIDPALVRVNLNVKTFARVTRILINEQTKTAYGVEFLRNGKKYLVRAKKEVILSAGTFHSPQLLMLAGIGPRKHLEELGIKVLEDLPVGETLYDHIAYVGLAFKMNQVLAPRQAIYNPSAIIDFWLRGKGPYTSLGGVEALGYISTTNQTDYPDIELILSGIGSLQSDRGLFSVPGLRIKPGIYDKMFRYLENVPCWSILPMLLHPKSKGYLKLRSRNPLEGPLLYGNYYSDPEDIRTMIRGIRFIQKLAKTKAFRKYGSELNQAMVPGCERLVPDSDQYWECALKHLTVSLHHQIATCKMGPEGVVDDQLRVHGIKNLRVADSSVIPVTLSAHTSAPTMMIGEKAADLIRRSWIPFV